MAKNIYFGVGGKARTVKNAYVGIGGKARKLKAAYIGINGKAHQFWSSGITVTITGTGHTDYCYLTHNGTKYLSGAFSVNAGDTIGCVVYTASVSQAGSVYVNGVEVYYDLYTGVHTYNWQVPSGVTAITIDLYYSGSQWSPGYWQVSITY